MYRRYLLASTLVLATAPAFAQTMDYNGGSGMSGNAASQSNSSAIGGAGGTGSAHASGGQGGTSSATSGASSSQANGGRTTQKSGDVFVISPAQAPNMAPAGEMQACRSGSIFIASYGYCAPADVVVDKYESDMLAAACGDPVKVAALARKSRDYADALANCPAAPAQATAQPYDPETFARLMADAGR